MSTDLARISDGYYAVPDPDRPEQITYWRMSRRGSTTKFGPWPAKTRYGPQLLAADLPADPVERYAREQLEAEVGELAAAWKAGCNRG